MRYQWEAHDISVGRRVSAYNRTEGYMVVYMPGTGDARYGVVSLADGMIWLEATKTRQEIAEAFNDAGIVPDAIDVKDIGTKPQPPVNRVNTSSL